MKAAYFDFYRPFLEKATNMAQNIGFCEKKMTVGYTSPPFYSNTFTLLIITNSTNKATISTHSLSYLTCSHEKLHCYITPPPHLLAKLVVDSSVH